MKLPVPILRPVILALAMALPLGGCGLLDSRYERPAVQVPPQWTQGLPDDAAQPSGPWWQAFGDPELNRLVGQALARNNDLAAAGVRVRRAQLAAGLARSDLFPLFGGTVDVSRSRNLYGDRQILRSNQAQLTVSYELDLWGRLSRARDAAQWEADATEQDRQSAALSLTGTTAQLYWQIGFINQRLAASTESIAYARRTLELVRAQYAAGGASALEVAEAEQNLSNQQAAHTDLLQQRVEYRNALAILFDGPPDRIVADPQALPRAEPPPVRAGLPADLLGRRPDLRAAELRLRSALAHVDATRLSYYPPITLTGALGTASTALGNLLQDPVGTLGAGLSLPFLQLNSMQLNIDISRADFEERVVTFRQALYQAMADVENALSARTQLTDRARLLAQSLESARRAERLYEVRYRAGAVSLRFWLDAQEQRRNTEIAVAENRLNRLVNQASLYLALGGGDAPTVPALPEEQARQAPPRNVGK
ncbi:efflux transporter outer membrane subunit [Bordetella sp. 2513F-2]